MRRTCALAAAFLFLAGCGAPPEKLVTARGKLTKNGGPLKAKAEGADRQLPPGEAGGSVSFVHADGPRAGQDEPGTFNLEDGTFQIIGVEGKGIPPGKYKVVVRLGTFGSPDQLQDQFSRDNSKVEVTVPDAGADALVIDLPFKEKEKKKK